jgi:general stress protein YciG
MAEEKRSSAEDAEARAATGQEASAQGKERSATEDLAEGLELMLRAARKAMRGLDPSRVEELGKRAMRSIESLDAKRVQELGRKAAQHMDPKKIEEIAEDAGRELLGVVERVADRVESVVGVRRSRHPEPGGAEAGDSQQADAKKRVRVDGEE